MGGDGSRLPKFIRQARRSPPPDVGDVTAPLTQAEIFRRVCGNPVTELRGSWELWHVGLGANSRAQVKSRRLWGCVPNSNEKVNIYVQGKGKPRKTLFRK